VSRVRLIALLAVAVALLGGACGSDGNASPTATAVTPTTAATTVPAPVPTTTAAASGTTSRPGAPAARRPLVLTGISIADFSFGAPKADTVAGLSRELGPAEQGPGESCPGFTFASWGEAGVSVLFDESGLVGWWVRKPDVAATREGVEVGDSLGDLREQFGPGFIREESSVGPRVIISPDARSSEEYYGTADAEGDAGRVTNLYAGRNCIAE
jgi:hypothetical protein